LIDNYGINRAMHGLYFISFWIASAIALFRLRYLKETIESPYKLEISVTKIPDLIFESYRSLYIVLKEIPRRLYILSFLVSISVFFASLVSSFWIIRAEEIIGLTVTQWGTLMMVSGLVSVLLGIPVGSVVDKFNKKNITGFCLILGAFQCYLFLMCTKFTHVVLLAVFTTLTNSFMNPAIQSLFADMTPREKRGRVLSSIGGGGIWLMRGAWGSGVLGMTMQTIGTFISGYLYKFSNSLPWIILAASLAIIGILFIIFVNEPTVAEY